MKARVPSIRLMLAGTMLFTALGCGQSGPKTHPLKGRVELPVGDIKLLVGSHVEAALTSDPTVRASGEIREDGAFDLETFHAGVGIPGVREGTYQVRIILNDDDKQTLRQAKKTLPQRYLDFKTSGLSFTAPASEDVALLLKPR